MSPRISNHGISPDESASDSGWPLPLFVINSWRVWLTESLFFPLLPREGINREFSYCARITFQELPQMRASLYGQTVVERIVDSRGWKSEQTRAAVTALSKTDLSLRVNTVALSRNKSGEGSTTVLVVYTVVWRTSVVLWGGGNTAQWLVENRLFFNVPSVNFQVTGSFKPITAPYFPLLIRPRNFAKRQCKLQWLTPPTVNALSKPVLT
jgi:hypothetical protein